VERVETKMSHPGSLRRFTWGHRRRCRKDHQHGRRVCRRQHDETRFCSLPGDGGRDNLSRFHPPQHTYDEAAIELLTPETAQPFAGVPQFRRSFSGHERAFSPTQVRADAR